MKHNKELKKENLRRRDVGVDVISGGLESSPGAWKFLMEMFRKNFQGLKRDGCSLRRAGDFPWSVKIFDVDVSEEISQCRDGCSLWRAGDFPWSFLMEMFLLIVNS